MTNKKNPGELSQDRNSEISLLELSDVIDAPSLQAMMEAFSSCTGLGMAIADMQGKILVATGWKDICTKYHRANPDTLKHCNESDTALSDVIEPGTFKVYKCKNGLWDVATPIIIEGKRLGNLFFGQFFFDDEVVDIETFRAGARKYGFNEEAYLAEVNKIPRYTREYIGKVMQFYMLLARMISTLSYGNIKMTRALEERNAFMETLRSKTALLEAQTNASLDGILVVDEHHRRVLTNNRIVELFEVPQNILDNEDDTMLLKYVVGLTEYPDKFLEKVMYLYDHIFETSRDEIEFKNGMVLDRHSAPVMGKDGKHYGRIWTFRDITDRKKAEEALRESDKRFMDVIYASKDAILLIDGNIFVDCNEATAKMLGYATRKEFLMVHPSKLSPEIQPDGRKSFEKAEEMMKIAIDKGYNRFEWMHRKASGEDFLVEVSLTPISLHGKTVIHCLWRDLTEFKKMEEEMGKRMRELEIFYKASMGREERIIELKKEIDKLRKVPGQ